MSKVTAIGDAHQIKEFAKLHHISRTQYDTCPYDVACSKMGDGTIRFNVMSRDSAQNGHNKEVTRIADTESAEKICNGLMYEDSDNGYYCNADPEHSSIDLSGLVQVPESH